MSIEALIIWLVIGAIAGFLAGIVVKGYGFGVVGNIIVGILGAVVAGFILPAIGIFSDGSIIGQIISAVVGAIILLFVIGFLRRAT
jgi:uncharacterized membrane protein YeaQ/YmgE (transglycosylase-associated protein family)